MERIDFLGLQAFLSIANWGSFNRAAASLSLSQAALSHRLKKLEDELGVRLVARTTRQVTLTAAGVELLPSAQRIVDELSQIFGTLRRQGRESQDVVRFGCLPTIAGHHLPVILRGFSAAHPGVLVRVLDQSATAIIERVRAGEAEFGITIMSAQHYDLDITPIHQEAFVLVCRADHALAGAKVVMWSELDREILIKIGEQTGNNLLIAAGLGGRYADVTWAYEVHRVATAIGMVRGGLGVTVVPRLAFQAADEGKIVAVPLRAPSIARTIGIVTRRNHTLSPVAESLARMIQAYFNAL
ncbi:MULTISPECIES: LysR family transcriptional regulator [unclassified Methylobacterium]|uniref:LysR family transcriptional regulator n=1 Tax=unclassified Methylobacterium TaxID=2615210 RepID=UPI00226997A7|nr:MULTISPECIES: LysR family transcriptional regulator [unclassified Methylobacterium]